jgi:putative transposase
VFGVEPICTVLSEHGAKVAASTYYEARGRKPSRRALRDAEIIALIAEARGHRFDARKMWLHLRAQGRPLRTLASFRLAARSAARRLE